MLSERILSVARAYWATHFGLPPEQLFSSPFSIGTHGGELCDYCGAFALFRDGAVTVSIPPDRETSLRRLLSQCAADCRPASFAAALESVATMVIGPAYIGYAETVAPPTHPAREAGPDDAAALQSLQQSCSPTEWEHGGSPIEHPASGVFLDAQLVALAGYEIWGGSIAHISVITHPGFRRRGFGRSAVAHLAERVIRRGLLPQYRTLESNRASIRVAESLGFQPYASSMAVWLRRPNTSDS
jgi:GNAT superfamily N-acetyltransferase